MAQNGSRDHDTDSVSAYPWDGVLQQELITWLYLPDYIHPPDPTIIIGQPRYTQYFTVFPHVHGFPYVFKIFFFPADCVLLLMVISQLEAFRSEHIPGYPGGRNDEITKQDLSPSNNPVPDFVTYTKYVCFVCLIAELTLCIMNL